MAELLKLREAGEIIAAARTPDKAADIAARGVQVRQADYSRPETLTSAFEGASRLLLISGNELGKRVQRNNSHWKPILRGPS